MWIISKVFVAEGQTEYFFSIGFKSINNPLEMHWVIFFMFCASGIQYERMTPRRKMRVMAL